MNRSKRLAVRLGVLIVTVSWINHVSAQKRDDGFVVASDRLLLQVKESAANQQMPRLSNSESAPLFSVLSDVDRFITGQHYGMQDMEYLMDICGRSNSVVMSYVMFDVRRNVNGNGSQREASNRIKKNMNENVLKFQDEVEALMPFLLRCIAKQVPLITEFVSGLKPEEFTNIRREGLNKVRRGVFQTYSGFMTMVSNPQTRRSLRVSVFSALADTSDSIASILSVTNRSQIKRLLLELDPTQPDFVKMAITRISRAMSVRQCSGLCKY